MSATLTPQNLQTEFDEFCPECGEWKPLVDDTGWCLTCTRKHHPNRLFCEQCGKEFTDTQFRRECQSCRREDWQARNADRIEKYMGIGLPYELAKARVEYENRPTCNCCGNKIKGGTRGRHLFCRETPECRKAARRYKWFKEGKNMNRDDALQAVIESLQ